MGSPSTSLSRASSFSDVIGTFAGAVMYHICCPPVFCERKRSVVFEAVEGVFTDL